MTFISYLHVSHFSVCVITERDTIFLPAFSQALALGDTDMPSKPTSEVSGPSLPPAAVDCGRGLELY